MTTTTKQAPDAEVLEQLRDFLAEALRNQASMCAHTASHLRELGDEDAALDESASAMLGAWLAANVGTWTHTTRLRDGLMKFEPIAAAAALGEIIADDLDLEVEVVEVRTPGGDLPDDCSGDSEVCHACRQEHAGGPGGAFCPAAGYVRPTTPVEDVDDDEEGPQ
jgi:hypothetical protein